MNIKIRAAEPDDYPAIRETMMQPRAQSETLQVPFTSLEVFRKRAAELPATDHILVAELDGTIVGNVALIGAGRHARRRHVASLGITVHDAWAGKGVGSAMMQAALELADSWLQYTRIELTVFTDNGAAIALYQKFGFDIEGTLRRYAFRRGEFVDVYTMARLKK
ncbi:MAG: GNAT family N-acetyltransferase [Betaproteobacteria bacterium]